MEATHPTQHTKGKNPTRRRSSSKEEEPRGRDTLHGRSHGREEPSRSRRRDLHLPSGALHVPLPHGLEKTHLQIALLPLPPLAPLPLHEGSRGGPPLPPRLRPLQEAPRTQQRHLHVQRRYPVLQRGVPAGADRQGRGKGEEVGQPHGEGAGEEGAEQGEHPRAGHGDRRRGVMRMGCGVRRRKQ